MSPKNICLIGNPNSGKSSLFNLLTGLTQKVSNYPGVTVEKKSAKININKETYNLIDLPGLYSLYPNSLEEKLVVNIIANPADANHPDKIIYVVDLVNLERHLLLATQLVDLKFDMVIALNMADKYKDPAKLDRLAKEITTHLGVPTIPISNIDKINIDKLKDAIGGKPSDHNKKFYQSSETEAATLSIVSTNLALDNDYKSKVLLHHKDWIQGINDDQRQLLNHISVDTGFEDIKGQIHETFSRFNSIKSILSKVNINEPEQKTLTRSVDKIITHNFWGPIIFFAIMVIIFQAIYAWAEAPMDWIESIFGVSGEFLRSILPANKIADFAVDGVLAGLGGVLVFVPQISILFFLLAILEESGYMSRAVYLFDPLMRRFGLNGRSMVALISSGACAIPAIMSTRTIANWKERLITIMVSPLISCSARIPVYAILVGFVVPSTTIGIFNLQGLVFMGLYLLGIIGALVSAYVFKKILKNEEASYLMLELPLYKKPQFKNMLISVKNKIFAFIEGAGKVIIVISMVLWALATYGPGDAIERAEQDVIGAVENQNLPQGEIDNLVASKKIESSYIGHLGKFIEPAIRPLGFDWKIGIALITSFAAREVFVGTMATIYSIGSSDDEAGIQERMSREYKSGSNIKVFNPATSLSLLIFYVFAMQCMSTVAVTRRETNSWKWPIIQFVYMTVLAYGGSFVTYQLMSGL